MTTEIKIKLFFIVPFMIFISFLLFLFFGVSRVDAATKYVIYDNYNVVTEYASSDSGYVEKYFDTGSTNRIGFSIVTHYDLKKGETYNFDVSFSLSVTSQNAIVSCNNWNSEGRAIVGSRLGTIQTLKNANFTQSSCTNASSSGYPSKATYNFKGSFVASDSNSLLTFAFPFNSNYSMDGGRALTFRYSNFYFTVTPEGSTNDDIINNNNQNSQNIINNQTQNKDEIINNQDKNTNDIIDNQNKNNQEIKDSLNDGFNKCYTSKNLLPTNKETYTENGVTVTKNEDGSYTLNGTSLYNIYLYFYQGDGITLDAGTYTGSVLSNLPVGTSFYIRDGSSTYYLLSGSSNKQTTFTLDSSFIFDNAYLYVRKGVTLNNLVIKPIVVQGSSIGSFEKYGEICTNRQDETNNKLDDLNDNITNSDVDNSTANDFFSNFKSNDHGLSSIITAPLNFIKSMTSKTCSPISATIPLVDFDFTLPCFSTYYKEHFNSLFTVYQTLTFGMVSYYVCVQIYALVKGFKDPENDKMEVIDL